MLHLPHFCAAYATKTDFLVVVVVCCFVCALQNIKQIVDAIHTTAYLGVMHALLGCYSERKLWQLRHGSLAPQTLSDVMADERRNWALCQKDIKGLYVMDAELRDRLKRQGVEVR